MGWLPVPRKILLILLILVRMISLLKLATRFNSTSGATTLVIVFKFTLIAAVILSQFVAVYHGTLHHINLLTFYFYELT